ncbi:hypothetical protein [Cellulomonas sp. NTE-D12]|uniref:hypothetical protein n=1 Tax=Cellulomonas sp. NTE-D12 TaxID=2962632 RepID=UPI003081B7D9|nr:hypothetical protein CELD12_01380 [Cellulomonas sp. NTE-D12]
MSADAPRFEFVMVPDSKDARDFVEMSSHAADLVQAREALELAVRSKDDVSSTLDRATEALIATAAMAYCRAFFHSERRRLVTDFVKIPEALRDTHQLVRMFRNRTIAHSQSELSVTYAVAVLDAETLEVRDVTAPTVLSTMPSERVRDFFELVTTVQELLDKAIEPVRSRLMAEIEAVDRAALVRNGPRPAANVVSAANFDPAATRRRYPTSHPIYLATESGG